MYAVIFTATTKQLDQRYSETVAKLRELAFEKYNCVEFNAVTEGKNEIAVSYWHSHEDIRSWKQDANHLFAQQLGQDEWYEKYKVQVVKIEREYERSN